MLSCGFLQAVRFASRGGREMDIVKGNAMNAAKTVVGVAVAASLLSASALTEVSGDYTISGAISTPVVFTGDANLTIAENAGANLSAGLSIGWAVTNDGHNVTINLENGCKAQIGWLQSLNGAYTKINFKGGRLVDSGGWGSHWFKMPSGCTVELASVDGNPIWFAHPSSQHKYFVDSNNGRLFTSGTGRFYVQTANIHNGTLLYFRPNIPTTNYLHTGGACFSGNTDGSYAWIQFTADNCFPPGRVEIGRAANTGGAMVNLNGKSQSAEQVVRVGAFGGITNMSSTAGTLAFSKADSLLDCPVWGKTKVEKTGASTTLTVKSGPVSALVNKEGTVLVKPDAAETTVKVGDLRVYSGATLTVDGCTLAADTADIGLNAAVTCVNGGKLRIASTANATNVVDAMSWSGVALEKTGSGLMGLGSDAAAALSSVNVAEGTLKLGRLGVTNRFWRATFKNTVAGGKLALGPLRLYDRSLNFTDGGASASSGTSSDYVDKSSAGITASQLSAKEYICSRTDYQPERSQSGSNYRKPVALFFCSTVFSCMFATTPYPSAGNPESWVVMTYRIPDTAAATYGYDVRSQWEGTKNHPGTWTLESSPDGTDGSWELVDGKIGKEARVGQCWYHGDVQGNVNPDPYTFQTLRAGGGISPSANVTVAAGATLDATLVDGGQEISSLTVDCTDGGGTLNGVKLAAGGTINLVNVPAGVKLANYAVPLAFENAGDTSNARSWTVQVDGVATNAKLAWQNGGLFVPSAGTIVIFR